LEVPLFILFGYQLLKFANMHFSVWRQFIDCMSNLTTKICACLRCLYIFTPGPKALF
jgi:hypothetical protein